MNKRVLGAAVVVATVAFAGGALAQEAGASTGGDVGMTLPGAGAPAAAATQGESDHDAVVGRFGIGYLGAQTVPLADTGPVTAPVIGLRYWIDQMIGIDAGLGFFNDGGSDTPAGGQSTDIASRTAVLIHAGLPLSLTSSKHFSFQIVPEINVGVATQNEAAPAPGTGEDKRTGTLIGIGARAGGEIHFGFMGVPQLSLQAGVGVQYNSITTKSEDNRNSATTATDESTRYQFSTTVNGEPWNIFTSNIAALYYF